MPCCCEGLWGSIEGVCAVSSGGKVYAADGCGGKSADAVGSGGKVYSTGGCGGKSVDAVPAGGTPSQDASPVQSSPVQSSAAWAGGGLGSSMSPGRKPKPAASSCALVTPKWAATVVAETGAPAVSRNSTICSNCVSLMGVTSGSCHLAAKARCRTCISLMGASGSASGASCHPASTRCHPAVSGACAWASGHPAGSARCHGGSAKPPTLALAPVRVDGWAPQAATAARRAATAAPPQRPRRHLPPPSPVRLPRAPAPDTAGPLQAPKCPS